MIYFYNLTTRLGQMTNGEYQYINNTVQKFWFISGVSIIINLWFAVMMLYYHYYSNSFNLRPLCSVLPVPRWSWCWCRIKYQLISRLSGIDGERNYIGRELYSCGFFAFPMAGNYVCERVYNTHRVVSEASLFRAIQVQTPKTNTIIFLLTCVHIRMRFDCVLRVILQSREKQIYGNRNI